MQVVDYRDHDVLHPAVAQRVRDLQPKLGSFVLTLKISESRANAEISFGICSTTSAQEPDRKNKTTAQEYPIARGAGRLRANSSPHQSQCKPRAPPQWLPRSPQRC